MQIITDYAHRRIKTCAFCTNPIETGTMIFRGTYYKKEHQRTYKFYWHFERTTINGRVESCFIENERIRMLKHPYVPITKGPGRKTMELTKDQRRRRRSIIVMAAQTKRDVIRLIEIDIKLGQRKSQERGQKMRLWSQELIELGGVPNGQNWAAYR